MSGRRGRNRDDDRAEEGQIPLERHNPQTPQRARGSQNANQNASDGVLVRWDAELRAIRLQDYMQTSGMRNLMLSNQNLNYSINVLTAPPVEEVTYTVQDGAQTEFDKDAPYISENEGVGREAPVQKRPVWKARTAIELLKEVELDEDHRLTFRDLTPAILQGSGTRPDRPHQGRGSRVNISSQRVQLINSHSPTKTYHLECLCVELHGTSLVNLIANFHTLAHEKGASVLRSAKETSEILETLVEDARRLLVWSPILSRMAQRPVIQKSRDTRYGCDTGKAFCTLATSRGVAQTIIRGVSYLSELEASNSKAAFRQIKPKVMQMVVLLLSLLNDHDLSRIRGVLEHQYRLAADRQNIELTIMKVLTLESVGPSLFLSSAMSALSGSRHDIEMFNTEAQRSEGWEGLLSEMARLGWILPASLVVNTLKKPETSRSRKYSWRLQWDDEYRSTEIFDHLQFNGERNEVNNISPLKVQAKEFDIREVPVDFRDGKRYMVALKDLDNITLAKPGIYELMDTESKKKTDLRVDTEEGFPELLSLWKDMQNLYTLVEDHLSQQESHRGGSLNRIIARLGGERNSRALNAPFSRPQITQRRDKITMTIQNMSDGGGVPIAVCWLLEGSKTTQDQLLTSVLDDYNELSKTARDLRRFSSATRQRIGGRDRNRNRDAQVEAYAEQMRQLDLLDAELNRIEGRLGYINDQRRAYRQQAAPPDEAIGRVHYPAPVHYKQQDDMPWQPFRARPAGGRGPGERGSLVVQAERVAVEETPSWSGGVGTFNAKVRQKMAKLQVTPLDPVPETHWEFEVRPGDNMLLLGGLGVVLNRKGKVVNYLKLTSLVPHEIANPRPDDDSEDEAEPPTTELF